MKIVTLDSVSKSFGEVAAVRELSFGVERGEIFGLIGPNGAGKTTTIRMIMDIIKPDKGEVAVLEGIEPGRIKDNIGYLPEERGLYRKMRVSDVIMFFGRAKGLGSQEVRKRMSKWLAHFSLGEWSDKKVEELSKGMQQKLQIIATVLHGPALLILDEPFSGMDPVNTEIMKDTLMTLNREGTTIIFSTHIMEQAEKLCNSICLIKDGRAVQLGLLSAIKARYGRNTLILQVDGDLSFLEGHPLIGKIHAYENYAEIRLNKDADPEVILREVLGKVTLKKFEVVEPSLHSIYIEQVGGPIRG